MNKQLPLEDVYFFKARNHNQLASRAMRLQQHRRRSNFICSSLPSLHAFIPHCLPVTSFLSDNENVSVGDKHVGCAKKEKQSKADVLFVKCSLIICVVLSHRHTLGGFVVYGWVSRRRVLTVLHCSVWETRPCGQLQLSAVMSRCYQAWRRLSQ